MEEVRDGRDLTFQRSWKLCEDVYTHRFPLVLRTFVTAIFELSTFKAAQRRNFIHGIYPVPTWCTRIIYTHVSSTVEKKKFASSRDLMLIWRLTRDKAQTFVSRILALMGRDILSIWKFFHQLFVRNTCRIIESNNLLVSMSESDRWFIETMSPSINHPFANFKSLLIY